MDLVTPAIGLIFWTSLAFIILLIILRKYAWKPILKAVKDRDASIEEALRSAEKAKEEMAQLKADNEKIIHEAKLERDKLMKEAREVKDKIISDAKAQADIEARKRIEAARLAIESEKASAVNEIKNIVADMSIDIAEKILKKELASDKEQKDLIDNSLKGINLN